MQLVAIADEVFAGVPKATLAIWRPRFLRAALWFVELERKRRADIAESFVEITGERAFLGPAGEFVLYGRADRIDRLKAGGGVILDYKTGAPPSNLQVLAHLAPQLPLEGAVLMAGGFKEIGALEPAELVYVRISGGAQAGEFKPVKTDAKAIALEAAERLARRIAQFDDETMAYESRVGPIFARYPGDYDHLARVREWSASGWRGEGE
jgi:ATP-dependent helicase/nuclease subunit B